MEIKEMAARLSEPFGIESVKWRSEEQPVNGQVRMVPYLDARDVMDRLDEVFGMTSWHATFVQVGHRSVLCTIHVKAGDLEFCKTDVGSAAGDMREDYAVKAAHSDGLKRAAVHLGVGRYLYALTDMWVPADQNGWPKYRPQLPTWAMTEADRAAQAAQAAQVPAQPVQTNQAPPPTQPQPLVTQRLGGDGRQPVEVQLPPIAVVANHRELWPQLGPDDREFASKVGNAIGCAAGPKGSRVMLRRYYDEYSRRDNVPNLVRQYLDSFMVEAWEATPKEFIQ